MAVAAAYTTGLLLARVWQPPLAMLFAPAFAVLLFALVFAKARPFLLWPLLALTGWINLLGHTTVLAPDDLRRLAGLNSSSVVVRGMLMETPRIKMTRPDDPDTARSLTRVRVTDLNRGEAWQSAAGEIIVATPGTLAPVFFAGQTVEITGVLARPPPPLADGLFDYRDYLQTRGIYYELKTKSTDDWHLRGPGRVAPPLTDRFLDWSRQTLALGLPAEDEPLRLLWAMTLGWRTAFTGDISEPFLRAGTMHMFAIDGLRIALISGMLVALLRAFQVARVWCGLVAIPFIWFYTAATGWEASALRASVMMTIVIGGWALKRPGDLLNSLAAAALIILLADPRQLFEASFQLSFSVVLVIALMLPVLDVWIDRVLRHDPLLPSELVPGWQKKILRLGRRLAQYCALSLAAWVGSVPLSIKYFHLFSPASVPANLLAVPLGALALISNLGALICGHWLPFATGLFNQAAWFFMTAMTWVSVECCKIPGAYFYVPEISWLTVGIYYGLVIVVFSGWLNNRRRQILGLAGVLVLAVAAFWRWQLFRAETEVTVLPLNGGQAVYVNAAGQKNDWLIDCGSADAVQFTLKDFLRAQGVNHIPRLVLTEPVVRHCGGAVLLGGLFGIGELWTSSVPYPSSVYYRAIIAFEANAQPLSASRHHVFHEGDVVGDWTALHPGPNSRFRRSDDGALVLSGNVRGTKILLLSDLGVDGQAVLLADHASDLRADIVVAGLPATGEPLSPQLLAAIRPKLIILADSEFPPRRRAGDDLRDRLDASGVPVIYTSTAGAVRIVINRHGWSVTNARSDS